MKARITKRDVAVSAIARATAGLSLLNLSRPSLCEVLGGGDAEPWAKYCSALHELEWLLRGAQEEAEKIQD